MIKASAGGGGKGMRIARNDDDARYLNEINWNWFLDKICEYS
jgi:acetyl/propionyl-CoA carboxylase alpha subunit